MEPVGHYNQSVMLEVREGLKAGVVREVVKELVRHHDALRMRYERVGVGWRQVNWKVNEQEMFKHVDLSGVEKAEQSARSGQ